MCQCSRREEPAPATEERAASPFTFSRGGAKPNSPHRLGSAPAPLHAASFVYVGRARSHTAPISGIAFGSKDGAETLISVSEDQ
jgi:hypothetical protein